MSILAWTSDNDKGEAKSWTGSKLTWLYLRDNLNRGRATTNDGDSLPFQIILRIPSRAVHQFPLEILKPRYIRVLPGAATSQQILWT